MSYPVLRGNASVKIKKSVKTKSKVQTVNTVGLNTELFEILKEIRTEIARKKGVPAYLIFTDATLADMCRKMPITDEDFLTVNGVGKNKFEKYGEQFIKAITEFVKK